MLIYLIQHARSRPEEEDPQRGITRAGEETTRKMAGYFKKRGPQIKSIWHSDKLRAGQTVEIMECSLGLQNRLVKKAHLAPLDEVSLIKQELDRMEENVMVVGHLPHLVRLSSLLLAGEEEADLIHFRNSVIVCLERQEQKWQLAWMVVPDIV